jgi:WD40 repeat protein
MAGFSPDGQYIASAGAGGIARIWAARTAANLLTMDQHNIGSSWSSVTFSHDGQRIALSNDDKNAYIRDPLTGKDLQILRGHSDYVHDAVFSPDDRYVLTSSVDGTAVGCADRQGGAALYRPQRPGRRHRFLAERQIRADGRGRPDGPVMGCADRRRVAPVQRP